MLGGPPKIMSAKRVTSRFAPACSWAEVCWVALVLEKGFPCSLGVGMATLKSKVLWAKFCLKEESRGLRD